MFKNTFMPLISEQFFKNVKVEADIFYFDDLCKNLTAVEKQNIRQQFLKMLQLKGVCHQGTEEDCHIDNVRISCGNISHFNFDMRRKRSTMTQQGLRFLLPQKW